MTVTLIFVIFIHIACLAWLGTHLIQSQHAQAAAMTLSFATCGRGRLTACLLAAQSRPHAVMLIMSSNHCVYITRTLCKYLFHSPNPGAFLLRLPPPCAMMKPSKRTTKRQEGAKAKDSRDANKRHAAVPESADQVYAAHLLS